MASPSPGESAPARTGWGARIRALTLWGVVRAVLKTVVAVGVVAFVGYCIFSLRASTVPPELPVDQYKYLSSQGWGEGADSEDRQRFYYTPQGANVKRLRYSWFVNLERPWSREPLASPENMRHYRFVVDENQTPRNPDHLPVGFARFADPQTGEDLLDITCAACHTGELHVKSKLHRVAIRIDGGQAMHAFTSMSPGEFLPDLANSLIQTYFNPLKFTRFARKVLGKNYPTGYFHLHGDLGKVMWASVMQGASDSWHKLYPVEEGFGRTDAVQRISNNVFGYHIDTANLHTGNGPTSYPPIWNIWKFDWVQYSAEARQPLARNLGETLGVGADYKLVSDDGTPVPEQDRYGTSTAVKNLVALEDEVKRLKPPKWPDDIFAPIGFALDCDKAKKGQTLFARHCFHCHGPNTEPGLEKEFKWWMAPLKGPNDPHWAIPLIPIEEIGTDPNAARNFATYTYDIRKTGITVEQIRRAMLPKVAWDQERRLEFLQAELNQAREANKTDCWSLYDRQTTQAEFDAANGGAGSTACRDALEKLDRITPPSKQAACKGGPLLSMNGLECRDAVAAYEKAIWDVATDAEKVCPKLREAFAAIQLDKISSGAGLNYVGAFMTRKYFRDNGLLDDAQAQMEGYGIFDVPQVKLGYKPRPLAGIWATPPFLHNGSVPTLYELLSPVSERSTTFVLGERSFDPVRVGLAVDGNPGGGFVFDTRLSGNSNRGHEFRAGYVDPCSFDAAGKPRLNFQNGVIGPELTSDERLAIIEYLKIHDDDVAGDAEFPASCRAGGAPARKP